MLLLCLIISLYADLYVRAEGEELHTAFGTLTTCAEANALIG